MKTTMNLSNRTIGSTIKQMLYAFQVIIIALAIPLLSYMELSHTDDKNQDKTEKSSNGIISDKAEAVAYYPATK